MRLAVLCALLLPVCGNMHIVTDPDGTSLVEYGTKSAGLEGRASSPAPKHLLTHEVARQLLAERKIAKLKAHLEQAEVKLFQHVIKFIR